MLLSISKGGGFCTVDPDYRTSHSRLDI